MSSDSEDSEDCCEEWSRRAREAERKLKKSRERTKRIQEQAEEEAEKLKEELKQLKKRARCAESEVKRAEITAEENMRSKNQAYKVIEEISECQKDLKDQMRKERRNMEHILCNNDKLMEGSDKRIILLEKSLEAAYKSEDSISKKYEKILESQNVRLSENLEYTRTLESRIQRNLDDHVHQNNQSIEYIRCIGGELRKEKDNI